VLRARGQRAQARPARAVFYDPGRAAGSCSLGPFPAGGWYASLPPGGYAGGTACGSYLDVRGPRGWVRAEVVDLCPACPPGTVDLSRAAFARIADPRSGTARVAVRTATDPPLPGPLVLRMSPAPAPGMLAVQVRNHGNRLASVEINGAPGGRWQRLAPDSDGYWTGPLRPGQPAPAGRISLRVTDAAGHRVLIRGVALAATTVRTTHWMYPGRAGPRRGRATGPRTAAAPRAARTSPGCAG
jgi:expansin